jgi:hypothetical protein
MNCINPKVTTQTSRMPLLVMALLLGWFHAVAGPPGLRSLRPRGKAADDALRQRLRDHVIRANDDGLAVEPIPSGDAAELKQREFAEQIETIFSKAECWAKTQDQFRSTGHIYRVPILVHVHGGLNDWNDTLARMGLVESMMCDDNPLDRAYPVFISWPAGPLDSYGEHLFQLRRGLRDRAWPKRLGTWISSPVVLATDIAKAAVGIPVNLAQQTINIRDRLVYRSDGTNCPGWFGTKCRDWFLGDLFQLSEAKAAEVMAEEVEKGLPGSLRTPDLPWNYPEPTWR